MQCSACRHDNPAQAKFCLECGARLVASCSNCSTELPPSAKFCLECGERLMPSGGVMVSSSAPPEAYTPKHLAERILTTKTALEGERKQVTVLFADLKCAAGPSARTPCPNCGGPRALYPDRLAEQVERLAHHAFRGEVCEKAVTYLRQAGAKALAHSAYRDAVTCFEQALTALHPLPDAHRKIERAIDLRLDLRQSLFPLGELARVPGYLQEAEGLARRLDDPRRLGWVSAYVSGHHVHTGGHVTEVRTFAQTVDAIAERLGDVPLQIAAQYYLAAASHLSGDYRGTEHVCRQLMQSLHDQRTRERFGLVVSPAVWSRAQLARALAERGVFDEGDARGQEAIRIAEALDHPFSVVVGYLDLAYLKSVRGELGQAAGLLERVVAQCREWNITSHIPIAMASLGHVYASSGRIGQDLSCLQHARTAYERAGIGFHHSLSVAQLGEAYLLADQVEAALSCADRAVMLARGRGERGYEAWALRLLGDIASHHARPDVTTAAAHYGAAMALASELDMRPLVAHCHLGLGTLYRRTGNPEQAQEHLTHRDGDVRRDGHDVLGGHAREGL